MYTLRQFVKLCLFCFVAIFAAAALAQQLDDCSVEHFQQAMQAQKANDLERAETQYRAVIERNPKFAGAYLNLGIVYHQQKKYSDAIQVLKTSVQLDPKSTSAQLFLGIDEYLAQDLTAAQEHLRRAWTANPKDRQAGLYFAFDDLALNQPFAAIQVLQKTAKAQPQDAEVLYHLGDAHLQAAAVGIARLNQLGDTSALSFWSLAIAARQKKD